MDEKFHAAIRDFADSVRTKFDPRIQLPANPEDQLKTPIEGLFKAVGEIFSLSINTRTETPVVDLGGRPDVGVTVKNLLCGHVELKAPGVGANPNGFGGANKKQWEKFKALPNLIYTDGNEWALFRSGQKVGANVRFLGDITQDGADSVNMDLANAL
ncbi:MAG: DNA methyltransferase, partial [SAR324 cluster bacterium]|nr:DNA methyltransferase [SAR324 cluster bacterium]